MSLGVLRFDIAQNNEVHHWYEAKVGTEISVGGIVAREVDVREGSAHLYVQADEQLLLVTTHRYTDVSYGDQLMATGVLKKPEAFTTDLGRTFNYPDYLHAQGVSYNMTFPQIEVQAHNQGNIFLETLLKGKELFMQRIELVIPEPHVGLAEGVLLGVKQALGEDLEEIFRKTGIIHIVVLSGYNVMLVVIFITYILSYLVPHRAQFIFGLLAIITFALLVGLSATVVRASIMAGLLLFARSIGRTYAVLRALMFAGVVMILINPYLLIYDVGFQLSFCASLGLIFLAPYIEARLNFVPKFFELRGILAATIATQIFVTPLLLYQIGELSLISIAVNALVLPMVPVAMLLTFITGLVGMVSVSLAMYLAYITYLSLQYILASATFFSEVPLASVAVPSFSVAWVFVGYAVMIWGMYYLYKRDQLLFAVGVDHWTIEEEEMLIQKLRTKS
ncbi:MAG: competence protein ComEC [Patiriisocius sp.]